MKSPFKFLDSFTKEDRNIFFGREKEIEELYQRIFRSKIMLVYGVSGTGKSSLINCGLANKFQDEDWLPLNVRRGKNILESMYAAIVGASLTPKAEFSVSEVQFRKYVKSLYLDYYKPIYFIFDQFEELFIFGNKEEKSQFVRVVKAIVESDIQCRFIFVMREEYMASVTEFEKHIPVFFSNRVRIENMDINNAIQAVKGPCRVAEISVEEGFPEALIDSLSPGSPDIELTYLQVFLDKVYRLGVEEMEASGGEKTTISFTLDQLKKVGNVSDLLGSFLNEQISLLTDPETALAVLKSFVSVKGTKRQMTLEDVKEYSQTLGKPIDDSTLLEMLQNFVHLRILRDKDQHERYELRHDSLATKIFEKISGVEKDILEIRQFIEDGYHNWQKRGVLLAASDLDYIAPYESRLYLSSELLSFINQSKNQLEKIKQKRRVIFVASTSVLLIVFAGFTIWALLEKRKANKNEIIASANYYNALSKDIVNTDPTKALRIAEFSCKLDPSENNIQNLVDIYSNNEFYHTFLPTSTIAVNNFKVLDQSGNIAVKSGNKILTFNSQGEKIREIKFEYSQNFRFDISKDEKYYLLYSIDDTLRIFDLPGKIIARIPFKNNVYVATFLPDNSKIFVATTGDNILTLSTFSLMGDRISEINEPLPSEGGSFPGNNYSSDSIFYFSGQSMINCWVPNSNLTIKIRLGISDPEKIFYGSFISKERIAIITSMDSIKICDLKGKIYGSWYAGDEKENGFGFFPLLFLDNLNLLCGQNNNKFKIWNLEGQNTSSLFLRNAAWTQYNKTTKELLTLYEDQILSYRPNSLQDELIMKKENKKTSFYVFGNSIREVTGNEEYGLIPEGNKIEKKHVNFQDDKYFYKVPGSAYVRTHFPKDFKLPDKAEVTIFDIYDNKPLIKLKSLTEIPGLIVFSKDENLIASYLKLIAYNDGFVGVTSTTFFNLYNKGGELLRTFPLKSLTYPDVKISSDNKNILLAENNRCILIDTSGNQLFSYVGHNTPVQNCAISDDGNYILTGSNDKTARLWSRNGKSLKVINTDNQWFLLSFLPGENIFQITDNKYVKLYDINGVLLQKIAVANDNPIIYSHKDRYFYYIDNDGIHRARLKEPIDSFLLSNNHTYLSLSDKLTYGILSVKDIMESNNPNELFTAGNYYFDIMNKKTDVSEKRDAIKIAGSFYKKGLQFDTLQMSIARRLSDLSIKEFQYFNKDIRDEIELYHKIMIREKDPNELIKALNYYGSLITVDSIYLSFKYQEKAIKVAERLLELPSTSKNIKTRISFVCSNLAFELFNYKSQYPNSLIAARIAEKSDSSYLNTYTNLPIALLLNNMYDEALKVYMKWKDKPYLDDPSLKTFKEAFYADFDDLERRGITHPDFEKVRELLKK